jgi:hypothetical protein
MMTQLERLALLDAAVRRIGDLRERKRLTKREQAMLKALVSAHEKLRAEYQAAGALTATLTQ